MTGQDKFISRSKTFLLFIISFILGIFLANFYTLNYIFYIFISLFLLLISSIIIRNKKLLIVFSSVLIMFLGFIYCQNYLYHANSHNISYNKTISFDGVIVSYPDECGDFTKYVLKVSRCDEASLVDQQILIDLPTYPQYLYADSLHVEGLIEKPQNFDQFDYPMYLARYNIFALIKYNRFDENAVKVEKITSNQGNKIISLIYTLRNQIYTNFKKIFSEPQSGIMAAIILGLKRAIPADFIDKLRIVGLSHIVVISGFHVAVMIKIFQSITTSWSKKLVFLLGSLFLLFFIVLTGASPSVIRASIMAWLFLLAPILGRKGKITNILALTVLVMIIQNPLILVYDVSFQLSVLAVLGLIYLMPIFDRFFARFGEIIGSTISATLSAQIMTLPIILASFGRFSIVAPITNILITPFLPLIIPYGVIVAITSFISMKLSFILSWPLMLLLKYVVALVDWFSQIRFASVDISVGGKFIAIYFLILIIILYLVNFYEKRKSRLQQEK